MSNPGGRELCNQPSSACFQMRPRHVLVGFLVMSRALGAACVNLNPTFNTQKWSGYETMENAYISASAPGS